MKSKHNFYPVDIYFILHFQLEDNTPVFLEISSWPKILCREAMLRWRVSHFPWLEELQDIMMKFQAASPKCRSRSLFQVIFCLLYLMVSTFFKWNSLDLECCSKAKLYNFDLNCWCQKNSFYLITRHQILNRFILEYIRCCLFTTKAKLKRKVSKKNFCIPMICII